MFEPASTRVLECICVFEELCAIVRATADPALAAHRWAVILDGAGPFETTCALAEAALSSEPAIRRVVAEALVWEFPVVGADFVLEHLASDPSATVRFAVVRAAHARRISLGDALLQRLGTDHDALVAGAAAFALATR